LRLFITGYKGLLGSKIIKYYNFRTYPKERIDITKKEIFTYIKKVNPDIVIHCAAFTNVDGCEIQKEKAWEVNVTGTGNVAQACHEIGAKMIYVSTDFVFDGKKGMYKETDKTNPMNYYGKTKLEGEKRVQEICKNYVIARTSVLYGQHERLNFVTWVIEQLKNKNKINIVTDQYASPTFADNLAEVLLEIAEKDTQGLYHVTGSERINRYDFALKIADRFDLDKNLITPIVSNELNQKAERPKDSSLCVEKIKNKVYTKLLNIDEGLERM